MANFILQGTKEENEKAVNLLKDKFSVFKKKAEISTVTGQTVIVEAFMDSELTDYSEESIMRSLACCSNLHRDCSNCAYAKVQDCKKTLLLDAATTVFKRKE